MTDTPDEGLAYLAKTSRSLAAGKPVDLTLADEAESQRLWDLDDALGADDPVAFARRFGPDSAGIHELWDRIHVAQETWERYILDHPSALLDAKLYLLATQVSRLMGLLYQRAGERLDGQTDAPAPGLPDAKRPKGDPT